MERAQSGCVDQDLLRLDTKQEALEQACRIGMGRAPEHTTGRADQRRALGRIHRFDWCTLLLEQQQVGIGAVGLYSALAERKLLPPLDRRLHVRDILLSKFLEIRSAEISRNLECCGQDRAAIVGAAFDDFAPPLGIQQVAETLWCILRPDQIGVVADGVEQGS
jgi:hypothetical protein